MMAAQVRVHPTTIPVPLFKPSIDHPCTLCAPRFKDLESQNVRMHRTKGIPLCKMETAGLVHATNTWMGSSQDMEQVQRVTKKQVARIDEHSLAPKDKTKQTMVNLATNMTMQLAKGNAGSSAAFNVSEQKWSCVKALTREKQNSSNQNLHC